MASLPPPASEQTICITSGLNASDKNCDDVPISKVADYLAGKWNPPNSKHPLTKPFPTKRKECYERTQPTERESQRILNRVYVDIDGEMPNGTTEEEFLQKVEDIKAILIDQLANCAIKESCKWRCADESGATSNKLSFTVHFYNIAGTKKAISHYVQEKIAPMIQKHLKDVIPVLTILKKESAKKANGKYEGHLIIDLSVYNSGQRKMRMAGQTKPCQDRPYNIILGTLEQTLITYVPTEGMRILSEPQSVLAIKPIIEPTPSEPADYEPTVPDDDASDPSEDEKASKALLLEVIEALGKHRWDYYPDWIRIAFVMFNEGFTLAELTEFSKKSAKWNASQSPEWIRGKWRNFRKGHLTQALLWKWLEADDKDKYGELAKKRMDFWALVKSASHAETARFFYNLKPDAYLYNEKLGWYSLLPNGVWKLYERHPSSLLSDIFDTFKPAIREHIGTLDLLESDEEKAKIIKKKFESLIKFNKAIGTKSFNDGVIAFLPMCYCDDDLDKKMDENRNLIAFSDMVYDLDKHEARPIAPGDYICLNTGYVYPKKRFPEARAELLDCIRSVFEQNPEASPNALGALTSYVLKTISLCLHGNKKYEMFFIWTGSGRNGKGLIADMVKRVLGDYFHTIPHTILTKGDDKKDGTCPPLAKAKGKRCVMATEPEATDKLQVAIIKQWTGNDMITARDLYKSTVQFVAQFNLFLQTNGIPQMNRVDGAIGQRTRIIEFPNKFVDVPTEPHHKKININLKEKIAKSPEWRDEFWHLLIDAYRLMEADGLDEPGCVADKSKDYMDGQNPVKEWLEANFQTGLPKHDKRFYIGADVLRTQFVSMTRHDIGADVFKTAMEGLGMSQKKESHPWYGMRWVSEKFGGDWVSEWKQAEGRAGKYWVGLKRSNAPMPPDE